MALKSVLITGCNRGIGLGLVKEFLKVGGKDLKIFATCRDPSKAEELSTLASSHPARVKILKLEVLELDSYKDLVEKVSSELGDKEGLNLLINNAGIIGDRSGLESLTQEMMIETFKVNCIAPTFLARAFLPLLKKAASLNSKEEMGVKKAAIVQMSTAVASIAENGKGGNYPYRCSKSALNMAMKNLSIDLKDENILVMSMHPGWVKTDMGGPNGLIDTDTCVSQMVPTIMQLGEKDHGGFLRYNNTPIPW